MLLIHMLLIHLLVQIIRILRRDGLKSKCGMVVTEARYTLPDMLLCTPKLPLR
jgi:hypothetical protein